MSGDRRKREAKASFGGRWPPGTRRERVMARLRELARVTAACAVTAIGGVVAAQVDDPIPPPPIEPFVALVTPGVLVAIAAAIAPWWGRVRVPWRRTLRVTTALLTLLALTLAIAAVVKIGHWDPDGYWHHGPPTCLGANCFRLLATCSGVVAGVNVLLVWVGRGEPRRGYWTLVVAGAVLTVTTVVFLAVLVQYVLERAWYPFASDLPIVLGPALAGIPMFAIGVRRLRRRAQGSRS